MAMTLMNNATTMMTLGELNKNISKTNNASKKLASGMRLNSAMDGASEYAISEKMRVRLRSLDQDEQNIQNGRALINVGLGGMEEIKHSIEHMKELALGAANDTMTDEDRAMSQKVVDKLIENIDDIAVDTKFNGISVLKPEHKDGGGEKVMKPADFVFVVDITGSMGGHIRNVSTQIGGFADYLKREGVDATFAMVHYGDIADDPSLLSSKIVNARFGSDATAFSAALEELSSKVTGGGDFSESGLEAIMDPTDGALAYDWRDGADRHIVVITDADVHDADDSGALPTWYKVSDVVDALNDKSVKTTAISNGHREWREITEGTGGYAYSISSDYGASLRDLVRKISDPSSGKELEYGSLVIHTGTKANEHMRINIYDHRAHILGLRRKEGDGEWKNVSINPREAAEASLDIIDAALNKVLDHATTWGAYAQRLETTLDNTVTSAENTQASESVIRDADMAKEMAEYTKNNVLSQAAQSMLAQANQNTSSVLSLLQ